MEMFAGAEEKARRFGALYTQFAAWYGVRAFDAGSVARVSDLDGVHLDREAHRGLGEALAPVVRGLF